METIKHLTRADFTKQICDVDHFEGEWKFLGERPALIDFYATWCAPCKALTPVLESLAEDYEYRDRVDFYKIDIDTEQQLAAMFGVRSVPTLLFLPLKGLPQIMVGGRPKNDLKRAIDKVLLGK